MNSKLQSKLFKKYPKIFRQRSLPITETCMSWGFECDDGWYWLLDMLCGLLQWDIDHNKHGQIEAVQVKEKYGTLRFYTDSSDDKQEGLISFAEYLSGYVCEHCGSTEEVTQTKGWIVTLCKPCLKEYKKRG